MSRFVLVEGDSAKAPRTRWWHAVLYWISATMLVGGLLVGIFLGTFYLSERGLPVHGVIGVLLVAMGAGVVLFSLRRPADLQPTRATSTGIPSGFRAIDIGAILIGSALLVGGLLYGFTGQIQLAIRLLVIAALVLGAGTVLLRRR